MTTEPFRLLMIGAMYENGGNTVHRFLDGHPGMFVYPFESQLGTKYVNDLLSSTFPLKYRWPVFRLDATPAEDYAAIIDEETKVRIRTPHVSKFRHVAFDLADDDRRDRYCEHIGRLGRSTGHNVAAFFRATFDAWRDYRASGRERLYVGYSPAITIDTERILRDSPDSHVLHVVRNPWSAFADTLKRPVPLSLENYLLGWTINQAHALMFREKYPDRVHIVRLEDVLADPVACLGSVCTAVGLDPSETLGRATWNGTPLQEIAPWGTIRTPTPAANRATAAELRPDQIDEIALRARPWIDALDYTGFLR